MWNEKLQENQNDDEDGDEEESLHFKPGDRIFQVTVDEAAVQKKKQAMARLAYLDQQQIKQ